MGGNQLNFSNFYLQLIVFRSLARFCNRLRRETAAISESISSIPKSRLSPLANIDSTLAGKRSLPVPRLLSKTTRCDRRLMFLNVRLKCERSSKDSSWLNVFTLRIWATISVGGVSTFRRLPKMFVCAFLRPDVACARHRRRFKEFCDSSGEWRAKSRI